MNKVQATSAGAFSGRLRGRWLTSLASAFLLLLSLPLAAKDAGDIKLTVRVFRIPREQNFEAVFPDGKGGTVPIQAQGDVTGDFPRATVFFQTELAANASGEAVAAAILDRVVFGNGGITTRKIQIDELKSLDLELGDSHPKAEARFEENRGERRTSNYDVRAESLSSENGKFLIHLRFDAGWSAYGGSLGVGMSEDVISAPFEFPESKLFLIGAPASNKLGGSSSGAVYWLAVSAVSCEK
jgi:hypothetical protein